MKASILFIGLCVISQTAMFSQQSKIIHGPVIKDYGAFYEVNNPDVKTEINSELKVIFDVEKSSDDKSVVNKYIDIAARFLNMHVHTGMKLEQLKAAITIHGEAWQDVLTNDKYREKFGVDNPNLKLINALSDAGVDVMICGQSAAKHEMSRKDIIPSVKIVLSATTALIQYQNKGYRFVKY